MDVLAKLMKKTGGQQEDILEAMALAEADILEYTNRTKMLPSFLSVQYDIALSSYLNDGIDNAKSNSEGGISTTFITKDEMLARLKNKRLARVGGATFEKKQDGESLD